MTDNSDRQFNRRRMLYTAAGTLGATALASSFPGASPTADAETIWRTHASSALSGLVTVGPGDAQYPDLVQGLEQRWIANPEWVNVVTTTDQVVQAVEEAARAGKRLTVRSGGHCYEDFVYNSDVQVIVDMSEMDRVYFDDEQNAFAVEGGAILLEVYERLFKGWGVTIPGGQCYSVGAGGHVTGGGWGLLCRRDGLVVDHLYAVEVVVVDEQGKAKAVVATRNPDDPNHDLWWAHTGGGGGSFGIVTRFWFRSPSAVRKSPEVLLPRPPREVLVHAISWEWDKINKDNFSALVRNFCDWHVKHAQPGGKYSPLCSFLNLNHRSNGEISLLTQMDATVPDAEKLLREFVATIERGVSVSSGPATKQTNEHGPLSEFYEPQKWSWLKATRYLGTGHVRLVDPTLRGDHKSAYHRRNFSDSQIDVLYKYLNGDNLDNSLAQAAISSFGGQVNAVSRTNTAQVHRDSAFKVLYQSNWAEESDDEVNIAWLRSFYDELYAGTGGVPVLNEQTDGCFINYCDIDLSDSRYNRSNNAWHELYWGENYPRLQDVKGRWDPTNFFRHGQSVRLPEKP